MDVKAVHHSVFFFIFFQTTNLYCGCMSDDFLIRLLFPSILKGHLLSARTIMLHIRNGYKHGSFIDPSVFVSFFPVYLCMKM